MSPVREARMIVCPALAIVATLAIAREARAQLTVTVVDDSGAPITNGFRWQLEEDTSHGTTPGVPSPNAPLGSVPGDPSYTLGVNIHRSHAPTICVGDTAPANTADTFPATPLVTAGPSAASVVIDSATNCPGYNSTRKYIVSVLPWHTSAAGTEANALTGYTMSGRNVAPGQTNVVVVVHPFPVPTAQITCLVFEDNQPINAAFDLTAEHGLPGFEIILNDALDKLSQDAFGNPLGTTYRYLYTTADGRPADSSGTPLAPGAQPEFQREADGTPVIDYLGDNNIISCPGDTKPREAYTAYENANCIDPYTLAPLDVGEAVIRYLTPNKYGIEPVPPDADPTWLLTGTLEGTRANDTWVRATEPRFNIVLGQLNWLVFFGFVKPSNTLATVPNPSGAALGSVGGTVVYAHDMHPPLSPGLSPGLPVPNAFVGINNLNGNDEQVYTMPADPQTGRFDISGIVPGTYELAFWDLQINAIIDFRRITIAAGQSLELGPVSIYRWFGTYQGSVFFDRNRDGFRQPIEAGISSIPVNIHFTDGSLYGTALTDANGDYSFPQYFPYWRYLITDIDFSRFRPTGMTAYIDNGGPLPDNELGARGINPQLQADGLDHRTERGPTLTEAIQLFADMTSEIHWGKAPWSPGENGGVHGFVNYAATRTEEDPSQSAIDPWEPSIPRVRVRLHQARQDCNAPGASLEGNCWVISDTAPFPLETTTSSWDDQQPTGCLGTDGVASQGPVLWANPELVNGFATPSCAETFRNWDQIRPGVADGAYWFDKLPNGRFIPAGDYAVEVIPPDGYEVLEWSDRNIDIGDPKTPFLTQPPECVGALYDVPPYRRMFPDQLNQVEIPGGYDEQGNWTFPRAAACNLKHIGLNPGANPEVDFNLFTFVPKAAHVFGAVFNDLLLEFNPLSPNASGNFGVPWLPVAIKDWTGIEVARFYTDQWGHFDGLLPANYDIIPPIPLGLVLSMYTIAPNDPGPILDTNPNSPTYQRYITDPWFDPEYSQEVIRENWEFYSGRTTFVDTIVLPVGAFVGNRVPLNCDYTDHTPVIREVSDVILPQTPGGFTITITSMGQVAVPNPNFDPTDINSPAMVSWDHGFGSSGAVRVGGTEIAASDVMWAIDGTSVRALIPNGLEGQLILTRGDNGISTTVGVTLHAANLSVPVIAVAPPPAGCTGLACGVIQPAIDAAPNGALILLSPGTYQENVILWKPITLQGRGAPVTVFDNTAATANLALKDAQFARMQSLISAATGGIDLVPNESLNFTLEEGAGILVGGCSLSSPSSSGVCQNDFFATGASAQIDGVTITGATEQGGGILINGFAANLRISNNDIFLNQGSIGGGIRSGQSGLIGPDNPTGSSSIPNLVVANNRIAQNGSLFDGGGGLALYAGSDDYTVRDNFICGNFSANYGGGIGHFGLSSNGRILNNVIVSNESFDEGGGIHVGGENAPAGATTLSLGSGSVLIAGNLIEGNKGGDDGGGIRTRRVNGADVASNPSDPSAWYAIDITNNLIVDNSSADNGGGIAFDDTVRATVIANTVANNDSTATGSDAFGGACTENSPIGQLCPVHEGLGGLVSSIPQVAGVSSFAHSSPLDAALNAAGGYCSMISDPICANFSNPSLVDDIVYNNRSFYWDATANSNLGGLLPAPGTGIWDLAVYGTTTPVTLSPTFSLLTSSVGATPDLSNIVGADPQFIDPYFNIYQATSGGTSFGNFVIATFTPNGVQGDYHVGPSSPVIGTGSGIPPGPTEDYDGDTRSAPICIGADER